MTGRDDPADGLGRLLEGRVAVISGAGAGIGAATAVLFARHGARVVIAEIDPDLAADTSARVAAVGGSALVVGTDVRSADGVEHLRRTVLDAHGRVDVLVNNVGHWVRQTGDFLKGDPDLWSELHLVNLWHVLLMSRAFLPSMIDRGAGSIVNVSSVEGLRGYPLDPVYGAYKAAVVQFTRSLAVQVGHRGVRVNGIGPDVTESRQVPYSQMVPAEQRSRWPQWVPVGRMGDPADQARVLLFLASDLSSFVTGHTIPTDGGTAAAGGWFRSPSQGGRWTNRPVDP